MKIWSDSIPAGGAIPSRFALGRPHPQTHAEPSENVSPHLAFSDLPSGTKSLALLVVDPDAPVDRTLANRGDLRLGLDTARADFFHWMLVDIPPSASPLSEGEFSRGVTARGKPGPDGPRGTRSGLNDYTRWFEGDAAMDGKYFGYDGPWPPWNDELVHRYEFRLLALDVPRFPLEGPFDGRQALAAARGHVLGESSFVGTYRINPQARERA